MRIRMEQPRRVTLQVGLGRTRIKGRIRRGRDEAPPRFQKFELVVDTGPGNAYLMIRRHTQERGVRSEIYVTDGLTLSTPRSPEGIDALQRCYQYCLLLVEMATLLIGAVATLLHFAPLSK
jgi:hypothetical protein